MTWLQGLYGCGLFLDPVPAPLPIDLSSKWSLPACSLLCGHPLYGWHLARTLSWCCMGILHLVSCLSPAAPPLLWPVLW